MEAGGYFSGFYTSLYVADNLLSEAVRTRYAFWIAQWNSQCTYKGQYGLWQNSSKGTAPGINGPVDLDLFFVNYPEIIRKGGFNGYGQVGPLSTLRREQPPLPYSLVKMPWETGVDPYAYLVYVLAEAHKLREGKAKNNRRVHASSGQVLKQLESPYTFARVDASKKRT